ncbi:MAG TPA: hypothetical protein DDZ66_12415 [Firmicutes bacterium]|jgi:hypothetical protein|nr:hypothetical protein [Bacillota bacterium]
MKTKSRLLGSTIFFLAAILLTGCVGGLTGGDTDQTVQGFLTEVTSAIVSLGPERIAALIDFPIIFSDEIYNEETGTVENIDVNITSANFVDFTQDAFDIARADGTRLLVKITVKDDGILYGQNTAVITWIPGDS